MFPVGLVSGSPVSTPIVEDGKYSGFYVGWNGKRKFPLDMAGFAFSVKHYRQVILELQGVPITTFLKKGVLRLQK